MSDRAMKSDDGKGVINPRYLTNYGVMMPPAVIDQPVSNLSSVMGTSMGAATNKHKEEKENLMDPNNSSKKDNKEEGEIDEDSPAWQQEIRSSVQ